MGGMRELESLDTIITVKECLLSEIDYRYLDELYAPIIGIDSLALYRALYGYRRKGSHEVFLKEKRLTKGDFLLALEPLEALGLVRTFLSTNGSKKTYTYYVFAPLPPREFFDSPLHKALLEEGVGKEASQAIYEHYSFPALPTTGEVSTSFRDHFAGILEKLTYEQGPQKARSSRAKIKFEFEKSRFYDEIHKLDDRFSEKSFSKDEIKYISSLSTMYNYSEETLAGFVVDCFDFSRPYGKRLGKEFLEDACRKNVNLSYLKKEEEPEEIKISGSSAVQKTLRQMQEDAPAAFLQRLQKDHKPAAADLKILRHLSTETGMSSAAINALVFHVLVVKGDNLNLNYCEKVGAGIVRKGLTNAIDVTDYLQNGSRRRKKVEEEPSYTPINTKVEEEKPVKRFVAQTANVEEEEDDTDYDAIFQELREREGR